jgi:hypothetical protein
MSIEDKVGQGLAWTAQRLNPDQQVIVAGQLPDDVLREDANRRGIGVVPDIILASAGNGYDVEQMTRGQRVFRDRLERFVDPDEEMLPEYQLDLMREFWSKAGLVMPNLSAAQGRTLEERLAADTTKRVVPSPIFDDFLEYGALLAKASTPPNRVPDAQEITNYAHPPYTYVQAAIAGDGATVTPWRREYTIGFKTPTDEIVLGRKAFKQSLTDVGQVVTGPDGKAWTYPIVDLSEEVELLKHTRGSAKLVTPLTTTELLFTVRLLHQAASLDNPGPAEMANEAVYRLGKTNVLALDWPGQPDKLSKAVLVAQNDRGIQIESYGFGAIMNYPHFGNRPAISGI